MKMTKTNYAKALKKYEGIEKDKNI